MCSIVLFLCTNKLSTSNASFIFSLSVEPPSHLSADFAAKLTAYKNVNLKRQLLKIPYISISDYLHYLRDFAEVLSAFKSKVLFYLAAAVSDFYVPQKEMVSKFIYK